ncbi:hypothetical protein BCR32DRAFT_288400, partial [Anaeromyces robustus]
ECCSKDGKCGTTSDYCYISKNCQTKYGYCIDECEEINEQLKKFNEHDSYNVKCIANSQKKVQTLELYGINEERIQKYMDQLINLTELESLSLVNMYSLSNFESIKHFKNLTKLEIINTNYYGSIPDYILSFSNLKTLKRLYNLK